MLKELCTFNGFATAALPTFFEVVGVDGQAVSSATGRGGNNSARFTTGNGVLGRAINPGSNQFGGLAFAMQVSILGTFPIMAWANLDGSVHLVLTVNNDGSLSVWRNTASQGGLGHTSATRLYTTVAGLIQSGTIVHVGAEAKIHASAGTFDLWVNGANRLSQSGFQTQFAGITAGLSLLNFGAFPGSSGVGDVSDLMMWDDTGSGSDVVSFPGDKIGRIRRVTGDLSVQFSRSGGATNASCVDDTTPDDDATTVSSSNASDKDVYSADALVDIGSGIVGQQIVTVAKKTAGGTRALQHVTRSGGTDYLSGTDLVLGSEYAVQRSIQEQDPDTSSTWTPTGITNSGIGQEVTT